MSNQVFPSQLRGLTFTVVKTAENSVIVKDSPNFISNRLLQSLNPRWHWRLEYSLLADNVQYSNPNLTYTDLQTLLGFIQARNNSFDSFLFSDPDDNLVGPGVITSTWQPNYPYMLGSIVIASGHAQQVVSAPAGAVSGLSQPAFSTSGGTTPDGGLIWQDLGLAKNSGTCWPNPKAQLQVVTDGTNYYSPIQRYLGGQFYEDISDLNGGITLYQNGVQAGNYSLQFGGLSLPNFTSNGLFVNWGNIAPTQPVTATFNYFFRVRFEEGTSDFEKFANQFWAMGGEQGQQGKGYLKLQSLPTQPGTSISPGSIAPPIPYPPGATNFLILHPQSVTYNNGGLIGVVFSTTQWGYAAAGAGPQAWYGVQTNNVIAGAAGGNALFSGYPTPNIPRSVIKDVYSYIPFSLFAGTTATAIATQQIHVNGGSLSGANTSTPGHYFGVINNLSSTYVSLLGGGVTAANINFTSISQFVTQLASIYGFYGSVASGAPMVIVYY